MWIRKGNDKDGPRRIDADRHERIRFTSDDKDSAFPQTVGRSVLCEVRTEYLCHFSLQRINMWIRKGNDKDGPRRMDPDRHGRIRFTSEVMPRDNKDSAFPQTDHEPQHGLYIMTYCLTDRHIRRITCMWTEISFLENTSIDGVMDCALSSSLYSSAV